MTPPPAGCSNSLGIPDNPYGTPRMMLNMDDMESSSSESEISYSDELLSESDEEIETTDDDETGISSGQDDENQGDSRDEFDRLFHPLTPSSSSSEHNSDSDEENSGTLEVEVNSVSTISGIKHTNNNSAVLNEDVDGPPSKIRKL
ncbi:hypothetical protein M3Y98_00440400 [Aphelenchoides besseyi]|nr:hypothetical protein M3Y98_00440400 [Aphelenchoides besseyi]KAI6202343.1 hypothetical protein M3Y96_00938200 [Aphelenchoides besseyi]